MVMDLLSYELQNGVHALSVVVSIQCLFSVEPTHNNYNFLPFKG